jgi:flagellar biosynthesis component FlhA
MEPGKSMKNLNHLLITVAMAATLALVFFMPAVLMDMLMAVNFILSLFLFIAAIFRTQTRTKGNKEENRSEETAVFSIFPIAFLLCAVFGLAAYVALTRLILISETEVESKIISFISGLVSAGGTIGSIVGSFASIMISCVIMAFAIRSAARISEIAGRFILDTRPMMTIERAYACGEISKKAFIARKDDIGKENNFLDAINGTYKFIAGNKRVMIFIMALGVLGNIIIGTNLHGWRIQESAGISIAYGIGGAIFFLFPSLMLSVASCIIILNHGR